MRLRWDCPFLDSTTMSLCVYVSFLISSPPWRYSLISSRPIRNRQPPSQCKPKRGHNNNIFSKHSLSFKSLSSRLSLFISFCFLGSCEVRSNMLIVHRNGSVARWMKMLKRFGGGKEGRTVLCLDSWLMARFVLFLISLEWEMVMLTNI